MTDRFHSLTVVLETDTRQDDAESLIKAIMHFRGVKAVSGNVASADSWMAEARAKQDMRSALLKFIQTETAVQ